MSHYTYRVTAEVIEDDDAVMMAQRKAGRFILATNELDKDVLATETLLDNYRGQQAPERGFGILKDPLFFPFSVFLKGPNGLRHWR